MTKLASQMTSWDYEQFALTEVVNPHGFTVHETLIWPKDTVIITSRGATLATKQDGGFVLDKAPPVITEWEQLWRRLIEICENKL